MTDDILEKAKKALIDDDMTYEDYNECISRLIAEVERLRSLTLDQQYMMDDMDKEIVAKDARIKELEAAYKIFLDGNKKVMDFEKKHTDGILAALSMYEELEAYNKRLEAAFLKPETLNELMMIVGAGATTSRSVGKIEQADKWDAVYADMEKARAALEEIKAKIGSGNYIVGANHLILTTKQREAIEIALEYLVDDPNDGGDFEIPKAIKGLRDLLNGKAGGKDDSN